VTRIVRIGIIDSGVNQSHPHVGNIVGGVTIESHGESPDYSDLLGHGTAIASLIRQQAPDAHLIAVKIFHRSLAADIKTLIRAITWCTENGIDVINLSLGTTNTLHQAAFQSLVRRTCAAGAVMVSAAEMSGQPALPGSLPGVVGVLADFDQPWLEFRTVRRQGRYAFCASPFPRNIAGVPRNRNLQGISFAVAHISSYIARLRTTVTGSPDWEQVLADLRPIINPEREISSLQSRVRSR
jgi:subtilisin family serine protease